MFIAEWTYSFKQILLYFHLLHFGPTFNIHCNIALSWCGAAFS